MVNGTISELGHYLPVVIRNLVMNYIQNINEDSEEKYTYLFDDKVYGRVMSYDTLPKQKCKIEAHNKYVDIQISIVGMEGIEVYQRKDLKKLQTYDAENDVEFYKYDGIGHFAVIENIPGRFTMLFPADAHQPKISLEGAGGHVTKCVVKVDRTLFL